MIARLHALVTVVALILVSCAHVEASRQADPWIKLRYRTA